MTHNDNRIDYFEYARQEFNRQRPEASSDAATLFIQALSNQQIQTACALLMFEPDLLSVPPQLAGVDSLHWAVCHVEALPVLRLLLSIKTDWNPIEIQNPIEWAVESKNAQAVALLLENGAQVTQDHLFSACRNRDVQTCSLCLQQQLNPFHLAPSSGRTPSDYIAEQVSQCNRRDADADRPLFQIQSFFDHYALTEHLLGSLHAIGSAEPLESRRL